MHHTLNPTETVLHIYRTFQTEKTICFNYNNCINREFENMGRAYPTRRNKIAIQRTSSELCCKCNICHNIQGLQIYALNFEVLNECFMVFR